MKGTLFSFILLCCSVLAFGKNILLSQKKVKAVTLKDCGRGKYPASGGDRIVGGDYVNHGQYPWMVSLYKKDGYFSHYCGATILNENWVVTAAHCIKYPSDPSQYKIYAGLHNMAEINGPTVKNYKVSEIYKHGDYYSTRGGNDIALLKTSEPIDISGSNGYINGICLPNTTADPTGFARATGWGDTQKYGYKSDILKQVLLPILDNKKCSTAYENDYYIYKNMLCAGQKGRDTCQADSGGPLFQTDENGVSTLIGITSFGIGCGDTHPGVYTHVAHHVEWMLSIILR